MEKRIARRFKMMCHTQVRITKRESLILVPWLSKLMGS